MFRWGFLKKQFEDGYMGMVAEQHFCWKPKRSTLSSYRTFKKFRNYRRNLFSSRYCDFCISVRVSESCSFISDLWKLLQSHMATDKHRSTLPRISKPQPWSFVDPLRSSRTVRSVLDDNRDELWWRFLDLLQINFRKRCVWNRIRKRKHEEWGSASSK